MNNNSIASTFVDHVTTNSDGTTGVEENLATALSTTVSHPSIDGNNTNSEKATSVHCGSLTTSTFPGVTTSNGAQSWTDANWEQSTTTPAQMFTATTLFPASDSPSSAEDRNPTTITSVSTVSSFKDSYCSVYQVND